MMSMRIATIIVIASVLHDFLGLITSFLPSLFLCNASASLAVAAAAMTTDEYGDYNGLDLIEWIRSHPEGVIHPSLRIGRERPGDVASMNGLFVSSSDPSAAIQKGEVIARIPWDRMITPGKKYNKQKYFSCRAIYNLANELDNADDDDKSRYGPYITYLKSQSRGIMPGEWSPTGQMFLASYILNNGQLPPYENTWRTKFTSQWLGQCLGTAATTADSADNEQQKSTNERIAYWLASSRDEDTLMVPIYDMANHSNDRNKLNTISYKPNMAGEAFTFVASRTIHPGEQIYNSYNRCNVCSMTQLKMEKTNMKEGEDEEEECETYSYAKTFDLFVNFGFVELDYPQSWEFDTRHTAPTDDSSDDNDSSDDDDDDDTEIEFCLFKNETTDELIVHWGYDSEPNTHDIYWLKKQLVRLEKLYTKKEILKDQFVNVGDDDDVNKSNSNNKMSTWEWESIWRYHDAVTRAIGAAVQSVSTSASSSSSGATSNYEEF
jgi:hypothetical protein